MFGYVREYPPEQKMKHHVLYRAVYCGLCKSMGKCTGFCSRAALSYDGVFFALVRMALEKTPTELKKERCVLHPFRKHPIMVSNAALAYSARAMALLVYGKVMDDLADTRGAKKWISRMVYPFAAHSKKKAGLEESEARMKACLDQLQALEKEKRPSVDLPADCFGKVLADLLSQGLDAEKELLARAIGLHVGRWIYVADALDDWEKDQKSGAYNPLALVYGATPTADDRRAVADGMKEELVQIGKALDLIDFEDADQKSVIYHIVFEGMRRQTELLANGKTKKGERT